MMSFLVVFMLLVSFIGSSPITSYALSNNYKIVIKNEVRDSEGQFVNGAKYDIYKTHNYDSSGKFIELSEPKLVNSTPVVVSQSGTAVDIAEKGVYEVVQVERAPGYYSVGSYEDSEDGEAKANKVIVEFPRMENGQISNDQTIVISPKLDPILVDVGLLKTGEKTSHKYNGLNGVKFRLEQTHNAAFEEFDEPKVITEHLKTSGGGFIKLEDLREGRYSLYEVGTSKLDGTGSDKIFADAEGTHLIDMEPIRFTVSATSDGNSVYVYKHDEDGEELERVGKLESGDNPLKVDYYLVKENYRVSTLEKTVEGKEEFYTNIGVPIEFELETKIPTNIKDYKEFIVVDSFDSRLDYISDSVKVYADGKEVDDKYIDIDFRPKDNKLEVSLDDLEHFDRYAGKMLSIKFEAQLNSEARKDEEVPNYGELIYDNGFGVKETSKSNTVVIHPNEGSIKVVKVEKGNHENRLSGAVFALKDMDTGSIAKDVDGIEFRGITDGNGELVFEKVPFGRYELIEEKPPLGYKISDETFDIYLDRDSDYLEYAFTVENAKKFTFPWNEGDVQDIPDTGSMDMLLRLGVGSGMLVMAVAGLKDKDEDEKNK